MKIGFKTENYALNADEWWRLLEKWNPQDLRENFFASPSAGMNTGNTKLTSVFHENAVQ